MKPLQAELNTRPDVLRAKDVSRLSLLVANCTIYFFMVELMQNFTVARAKPYEC